MSHRNILEIQKENRQKRPTTGFSVALARLAPAEPSRWLKEMIKKTKIGRSGKVA